MKIRILSARIVLTLYALGFSVHGCGPKTPPVSLPSGNGSVPSPNPNIDSSAVKSEPSVDQKEIQLAVEKMLASESGAATSPIPKGSELRSAVMQGRILTLDFSSEFNNLADAGDTTESEAQKKIMASVRAFPGVDKLRVTVEGKPFNSQNTDWNTPFSVRLSDALEPGERTNSGRSLRNSR